MEGICRQCGLELKVVGLKNVVKDDDNPNLPTKLYSVLTMECKNPSCPQKGKREELYRRQQVAGEETLGPAEDADGQQQQADKAPDK